MPVKNFIKKVPTASIVLVIIAAFFLISGICQQRLSKGADYFTDAIDVENCEYKTENDGKYVCISGTPKMDKASVDPVTGVTAKGFLLCRKVEMYQYILEDDAVYKRFSTVQEKNIKGRNGEKYENPAFPEELSSAVILGEASMGEFKLGQRYLRTLAEADKGYLTGDYSFVDVKELPYYKNDKGFKTIAGKYYTNSNSSEWKIGDIRISYTYLPEDSFKNLTVFGMQKNGYIGDGDDESTGYITDTLTSSREISDSLFSQSSSAAQGLFILTGILTAAAVIVYFVRNKKKGGVSDE